MAAKGKTSEATDFVPKTRWDRQEISDTFTISVPGFTEDQIKFEPQSGNDFKISGANRFSLTEKFPSNYDASEEIKRRFENGEFSVTIPKKRAPAAEQNKSKKTDGEAKQSAGDDSEKGTTDKDTQYSKQLIISVAVAAVVVVGFAVYYIRKRMHKRTT